nr:hypothetical protein [Fibrobacter succinogenes]
MGCHLSYRSHAHSPHDIAHSGSAKKHKQNATNPYERRLACHFTNTQPLLCHKQQLGRQRIHSTRNHLHLRSRLYYLDLWAVLESKERERFVGVSQQNKHPVHHIFFDYSFI